ncbi:MFS transporter [Rhizobium binxianense]
MTVLDTNIVAIVLPTIAREFSASFAEIEWVISTYVLCFASLLLPAGAIADRFGRRQVFLTGIAAFTVASALCGLAPSARTLYLARALQGVGAAFVLAPALAIIGHTFHGESERNRAWAIWGGMMGLAMVLAPVAGGVIAYALGWRWGFFVNLPVCGLLVIAVLFWVDESRDEAARRLDPAGIVFFSASMFGLTWGLINGQSFGWSSQSALVGFAVGAGALLAFIAAERSQARPMLDLSLFGIPRFVGAVWAMFAYAACAQVMASLLPLFLQNGLGNSALNAGLLMLPFALAMLAFPYIGRRLGRWLSSEETLSVGLVVVAFGSMLIALAAFGDRQDLALVGMMILGSGGGLLNGETQKAIMSSVPRERAGMASGISTTARFSGILLGFATLSGILATTTRTMLGSADCTSQGMSCTPSGFADAVVAGDLVKAVRELAPSAQGAALEQARHAYLAGFSTALITSAIIAALSAVAIHFLMRGRLSR